MICLFEFQRVFRWLAKREEEGITWIPTSGLSNFVNSNLSISLRVGFIMVPVGGDFPNVFRLNRRHVFCFIRCVGSCGGVFLM